MIPFKVCRGKCGRALPETLEFFGPLRENLADGSEVVRCRPRCRECVREANRRYSRRYEERNRTDVSRAVMREHRLREGRRRTKERYAEDPETMRQRVRESRRRQRKNAAKLKEMREKKRMADRLRREREGVALADMKVVPGGLANSVEDNATTAAAFERLPAWPLAAAMRACDEVRKREHYAGCLVDFGSDYTDQAGVHHQVPGWTENAERNVRAWAVGERMDVQFDVVDRVLTALDLCWWEVYNEQTLRRHSLVISYRTPTQSVKRPPRFKFTEMECSYALSESGIYGTALPPRSAKYVTSRRVRVGDEGPDLERLERVRHTFECVGFPVCETCREAREREPQMVLEVAA